MSVTVHVLGVTDTTFYLEWVSLSRDPADLRLQQRHLLRRPERGLLCAGAASPAQGRSGGLWAGAGRPNRRVLRLPVRVDRALRRG